MDIYRLHTSVCTLPIGDEVWLTFATFDCVPLGLHGYLGLKESGKNGNKYLWACEPPCMEECAHERFSPLWWCLELQELKRAVVAVVATHRIGHITFLTIAESVFPVILSTCFLG